MKIKLILITVWLVLSVLSSLFFESLWLFVIVGVIMFLIVYSPFFGTYDGSTYEHLRMKEEDEEWAKIKKNVALRKKNSIKEND